MFVGASNDIKFFIGEIIETDPGGTKYIFILVVFFDASRGIKSVIRAITATDLGGTKYIFGLAMFVVASRCIESFVPLPFPPSCTLA